MGQEQRFPYYYLKSNSTFPPKTVELEQLDFWLAFPIPFKIAGTIISIGYRVTK